MPTWWWGKERQTQDLEETWEAVSRALAQALEGLEVMRGNEGAALAEELVTHLDQMGGEIERIKTQADLGPGLWQEKMKARLEDLLAETAAVDEARLAQEVAFLGGAPGYP